MNIRLETAEKCSCISKPPGAKEAEGLRETVANVQNIVRVTENSQEKRNLCGSADDHPPPCS